MNTYPAIAFIVKFHKILSWVGGCLPPIFLACLFFNVGLHWLWSVSILLLIPISFLFVRGAVEMVMVLSDMLLPK